MVPLAEPNTILEGELFSPPEGHLIMCVLCHSKQNSICKMFSLFQFIPIPIKGFPGISGGKESTCIAGDPSSIPGSGRAAGEGLGYSLQYSLASLVAQLVKSPPAMWETWVQSLDWENPLEKGKVTHSSILAWRIPWRSPWGRKELDVTELLSLHFMITRIGLINMFITSHGYHF